MQYNVSYALTYFFGFAVSILQQEHIEGICLFTGGLIAHNTNHNTVQHAIANMCSDNLIVWN